MGSFISDARRDMLYPFEEASHAERVLCAQALSSQNFAGGCISQQDFAAFGEQVGHEQVGHEQAAQEQSGREQTAQAQTDDNLDCGHTWIGYNRISVLNLGSKPSNRSGWYMDRTTVPI
ncbi:MAG: hypothetical protein HC903_29930 [Methylacidiphilales bacterium]|nr:hypothetical protein [Candidatus Methylacidiphilales bacterium]NJR17043.1 hypothetical protein [Calothrix sp. CSU_2_0]